MRHQFISKASQITLIMYVWPEQIVPLNLKSERYNPCYTILKKLYIYMYTHTHITHRKYPQVQREAIFLLAKVPFTVFNRKIHTYLSPLLVNLATKRH